MLYAIYSYETIMPWLMHTHWIAAINVLTNPTKTDREPVQGRQASVRWERTELLDPRNSLILSVADLPLSDSLLLRTFYTLGIDSFLLYPWAATVTLLQNASLYAFTFLILHNFSLQISWYLSNFLIKNKSRPLSCATPNQALGPRQLNPWAKGCS